MCIFYNVSINQNITDILLLFANIVGHLTIKLNTTDFRCKNQIPAKVLEPIICI